MIKYQSKKQRQEAEELIELVTSAIHQYKTSPDFEMELLDSFSRYPDYSVRNIILSEEQNKGAFGLASANDFQEMGYSVQEGEEAIIIIYSNWEKVFIDETGKERLVECASSSEKQAILENRIQTQTVFTHYKSIPLYDITQTDCPPEVFWELYPELPTNFDFNGSYDDYKLLEKTLKEYASKNQIELDNQQDIRERVTGFVRQLAYAKMASYQRCTLKNNPKKRIVYEETQKEMTAYLVSKSLGMDREKYQQSYLMAWKEKQITNEQYIRVLEEVQKVSFLLVDTIIENYSKKKQSENK